MATLDVVLTKTMLHTAARGLGFEEAAPASRTFANHNWRYELRYDGAEIRVVNLDAMMTHESHEMWMRVAENLHFGTPTSEAWATVPGVDGYVTLPFERKFLLRFYAAPNGGAIAEADSGPWQLPATVSHGFQFVFGYEIDPAAAAAGTLPTDLAQPFSPELRSACNSGDPSAAPDLFPEYGVRDDELLRVVVCVSLVCCAPRYDFDPGNALLGARFYPLIEIMANKDLGGLLTRARLARPAMSTPRSGSNDVMDAIGAIAVTDRNFSAGPIPALPYWHLIFDYYDLQPHGSYRMAEAVRGKYAEPRTDGFSRKELMNGSSLPYLLTATTKQPGQAEFDSIHLAPQMVYVPTYAANAPSVDVLGPDGAARSSNARYVKMAPFCQHDCLHVHWRWSTAYDLKQNRGWIEQGGEYEPYAQAGAPLVPPNQSVKAELYGPTIAIETTVDAPRPSRWQYVHHNGFGYALGTSAAVNILFFMFSASGWAELYDQLRFALGPWDSDAKRATYYERLNVAGDDLARLKDL
jgi:hypothetical protein